MQKEQEIIVTRFKHDSPKLARHLTIFSPSYRELERPWQSAHEGNFTECSEDTIDVI